MKKMPSQTEKVEQNTGEMHFLEHLGELRYRLLYSLAAIAAGTAVCFSFSNVVFNTLSQPYYSAFPADSLIGTGPAEAFILKLKASVFCGILISSPVLFYQLWKFISPGLYPQEKLMVFPFVLSTTLLFLLGAAFCYKVVFTYAFQFFFEQYKSINLTPTVRLSEHLSLVITAIIGFGVVFETPVLAFFLARFGILDHKMMIAFGRHAIVAIFIISAALTPPDVLTQFLMAGPLLLLYLLSIIIVKCSYRERGNSSEETPEEIAG